MASTTCVEALDAEDALGSMCNVRWDQTVPWWQLVADTFWRPSTNAG